MDNSGTQIKQESGSSGFMKKNESNLVIYEQLRIAAEGGAGAGEGWRAGLRDWGTCGGGGKGVGLTEHEVPIPQYQDCELCGNCDLGTWGRWGSMRGKTQTSEKEGPDQRSEFGPCDLGLSWVPRRWKYRQR